MYYIYTDEAGTSQPEPVSVVVGVIVHADRDWHAASKLISKIKDKYVPAQIREGFHFHAKEVWSGYRDKGVEWAKDDRAEFIAQMAAVPRMLRMAISLGRMRRDSTVPLSTDQIKPFEWHHIIAFWYAMLRADKYIRDWGNEGEVASIVAEDVPKIRRFLKDILNVEYPNLPIDALHNIITEEEKKKGIILQTPPGRINRIIDTVNFVEKKQAPLLQIADACAFVFRRYFSEQDYGSKMVDYMLLGRPLVLSDWQGPTSQYLFSFNPDHKYLMV